MTARQYFCPARDRIYLPSPARAIPVHWCCLGKPEDPYNRVAHFFDLHVLLCLRQALVRSIGIREVAVF